jgi:hypothetical protein
VPSETFLASRRDYFHRVWTQFNFELRLDARNVSLGTRFLRFAAAIYTQRNAIQTRFNSKNIYMGYMCSCPFSLNGTQCQFDYRLCKPNTCKNNGI